MPIKVTCQKCGNVLHAPDAAAGKKGKCPKCAVLLDIPAQPAGAKPATTPVNATPPGGTGALPPKPKPAPSSKPPAESNPFDFFGDSPAEPAPTPAPAAAKSTKPAPPSSKPAVKSPTPPPDDNPFSSFGDDSSVATVPVKSPEKPAAKLPPKVAPPSKPTPTKTPAPTPSPIGDDNPFAAFGDDSPAPAPKASPKVPEKPASRPATVAKPTPAPAPSPIAADNPFAALGDDSPAPAPTPAPVKVAAVAKVAEKPSAPTPARPAKLTPSAKPTPGPASDNPFAFLDTVVTDPALQPSGDAVRIGEALPPDKIPDGSGAFDVKVEDDPPGGVSSGSISGLYDVRIEDDGMPSMVVANVAKALKPGDSSVDAEVLTEDDEAPDGKGVRVRSGLNTETPSLLALRVKGYRLWLERTKITDPTNKFFPLRTEYHAESYGNHFTADSATELLGLIGLWETRGDNWAVRRGEPDVLEELKKAANRAGK